MFILHIDSGREMRGGQWQALYLMRGLVSTGHTVRLLSHEGSPLLKAAIADGIDATALRIAALAGAASGADLIHAHDARAHTLALLPGKPVVVSRRVAFPVRRGLGSRWKYSRAAHYIAVSQFVKQTLLDANVHPDRITVVYDGVAVDSAPPKVESRTDAIALDSDDPGKGRTIVQQASELAGIPVQFSNNLARDLPNAAVFLYITELEGLGSAALLAMSTGAVVLASRAGGLPEIVEDGVTGLLTSNDPQEIANALQKLLKDRALRERLAANAHHRVLHQFSTANMVNGTLRVYERMLS